MKKYLYLTTMLIAAIFMTNCLQACTIYFTNDTQYPMIIDPKNENQENQKIIIAQNETKQFGDDTKHANFDVYTQNESGISTQLCTIKQIACNMGKKIEIKATDIPEKINTELFTIKQF